MTDQKFKNKRTFSLCHPDSLMMSKGLCSRCYQKHNKIINRDEDSPYSNFVNLWETEKEKRSGQSFAINADRANERRRGEKHRDYTLKRRYGISSKEYDEMLLEQNNSCFICEELPINNKRLYVDHCHKTGKTRRLLCPRCNTMIGMIENSSQLLPKAIEYVKQFLEKDDRP